MTHECEAATKEIRVVIVQSRTEAILASPTVDGYRLPRVAIAFARPAEEIQSAARNVLELALIVLATDTSSLTSYAVAELIGFGVPKNYVEVAMDQFPEDELPWSARKRVREIQRGEGGGPFSRIGWLTEATHWLSDTLHNERSEPWTVQQYNAGDHFALVRFENVAGDSYWLKATGSPNEHEQSVTSLLSELCEEHVPRVLASRDDWNAWITRDCGRSMGARCEDAALSFDDLKQVVQAMAHLQVCTVGRKRELLDAGVFDQRLERMLSHRSQLFEFLDEAMRAQVSTKAPRLTGSRIAELRAHFEECCERVQELHIPDAIVHGDMNVGNIVRSDTGVWFLDWSEAYLGNPLVTLEHLLLLRTDTVEAPESRRDDLLRSRYIERFRDVCSAEKLHRAQPYMPFLAAVSAIYRRGDWFDTASIHDVNLQKHARILTRFMDRTMHTPACLPAQH